MRTEPPTSDPVASAAVPSATAAALPPDDPPEFLPSAKGVLVAPKSMLSVVPLWPNSGELVRPRMMAPAALRRRTQMASDAATLSAKGSAPVRRSHPRLSLVQILDRDGDAGERSYLSPERSALSAARASAHADSGQQRDVGVGARVAHLDPSQVRVDHLDGRDISGAASRRRAQSPRGDKFGRHVITPRVAIAARPVWPGRAPEADKQPYSCTGYGGRVLSNDEKRLREDSGGAVTTCRRDAPCTRTRASGMRTRAARVTVVGGSVGSAPARVGGATVPRPRVTSPAGRRPRRSVHKAGRPCSASRRPCSARGKRRA